MGGVAFRTAEQQVGFYSDQSEAMRSHHEAMECRDCEDFLQLGIGAFKWIQRAEDSIRTAVCDGIVAFDVEIDKAITRLYHSWLGPCPDAEKWIKAQIDRGYRPDNLDEFRKCCEEVRDILEQRTLREKARNARTEPSGNDEW